MTNQDLERILEEEPAMQPSAKFATRVMQAVRDEAAAPPPLAFPWWGLVPMFLGWATILEIVVATMWSDVVVPAAPTVRFSLDATQWIPGLPMHWGVTGWIALALGLTYVCVRYPLRLVSR